jgi:rSAM-associated Gly-rich repeat protein
MMSRHDRYLRFLTALLPAGVFGLSVALASSAAKATPVEPRQPKTEPDVDTFSVANELQAIRDAVDEASEGTFNGHVGQMLDPDIRLAWWMNGNGLGWGNGGHSWGNGGYPAWGNARPWGNGWGGWVNSVPWANGWRNGGWGNGGGWRNGGWGNGGWHNWHNGGWRN